MFSALKYRDFRVYWIGMSVSLVGTWMQSLAQSWLVFDLTGSAFLLGLVGFFGTMPVLLLSLFGGVVADIAEKRSILIITQILFMVLAFAMAVSISTNVVTVWIILLIALGNGIVMSFDAPARQSMIIELVGREHLYNAIALNSISFNSARTIGPALAGILVAVIGVGGCFYLNGFSFLAVIFSLFLLKKNNNHNGRPIRGAKNIISELLVGLKFIKNEKKISALIFLLSIPSLFGIGYIILMPVFAQDVLNSGAKGLGMLMSAAGVGSLAGALFLAASGKMRRKGRLLLCTTVVFSAALLVFSISRIFVLSMFCLVFAGWATVTSMATTNTLMQLNVPDEVRGRIMSAYMLTFGGLMPFGNLIAGGTAQLFGAPMAVGLGAVLCFVLSLFVFVERPELFEL